MTFIDPLLLDTLGIYGADQQTFAEQNNLTLGTAPYPTTFAPSGPPASAVTPPVTAPAPGAPAPTSPYSQQSGSAIIGAILRQAGLADTPELAQYAVQLTLQGLSSADLENRLTADINDPNSVPGKVIAAKYPALIVHNQAAQQRGLPQLSVGDFLSVKDQNLKVIQASGLTPYVDAQKLADSWITGFTSPAEAQARINTAVQAVFAEPPEVRAETARLFGAGDTLGAATAYYLDPGNALPKIQQQLQSGEVAGAAVRTGFGLLTPEEATQLSQQGVTAGQAQQGFTALGNERSLFNPLPGEVGNPISREQQLGAQFGGSAEDQQLIERQRRARLAVFGGGGAFNATQGGVGGLGPAA